MTTMAKLDDVPDQFKGDIFADNKEGPESEKSTDDS